MPTKPSIQTLNASSIEILNAIRAGASSTYQERIPVATQENITKVGNAMLNYEATQNEFLNALVNRIARVIITSKSYQNPLRRFKKGILEYGETVEEIFVNIAKANNFDPVKAETDLYKRVIPDVDAVFHRMNYQNFYKVTISNEQLRQAFLSTQGISDLVGYIIDSLYTGSEFDEFTIMKQLIVDGVNNGKLYPVTIPEPDADNAKSIVTTIKAISNSLEFMSSKYNAMGVLTHSAKSRQILILDTKFDAMIDVEVLASAFNKEKAEFMGQRVLIDDFGSLTGVYAALVDEDWFMVFDNWFGFTENYNGQGLYWNYFYHVWKTFSTSPFANAIVFTTSTTSVTGVTVTPATATVPKNSEYKLTATVAGTGVVPQGVIWSISGAQTPVSTVSYNGTLRIPKEESNTELTVTATSMYDGTKSGTSTITVG